MQSGGWTTIFASGEIQRETRIDVLLVAATARELSPLTPGRAPPLAAVPSALEAKIENLHALCLVTGPGPVNAALGFGGALARWSPRLVLCVGVGGAYPGSGLAPGDLAVATEEIDADTGVEPALAGGAPEPLSIPLVPGFVHGRFPCSKDHAARLLQAARSVGRAQPGPFVTSARVTASAERAGRLERLYGAVCESMEGAAAARAAYAVGAAFAEIRGITNLVGPRDTASWRFDEAIEASCRAARTFLRDLSAGEKVEKT